MSEEFPYEMIRSLLMEYLSKNRGNQFSAAVLGVIELAKARGIYAGASNPVHSVGGPSYGLGSEDHQKLPEAVRQLLWQFLVQGILVFGMDSLNANWPWYSVTEYGEGVLSSQGAQPYDPEGFMSEFVAVNPNADETVREYLAEAISTFNIGCFRAAALMLGCASEQLVLLLYETFESALGDEAKRARFRKASGWQISSKFKRLHDCLMGMLEKKRLPKALQDAVRTYLPIGFDLVRRCRNSAGHPEIPGQIRRETVFLNLRAFPEYAKQVLALMDHFTSNPAELP